MKSSKFVGVWRPVLGVAVVGAMALGVNALAGPRGTDQGVRETAKTGTEVTRLVTGDPAQINAAVAARAATTILGVTPVNPPPGMAAYPPGVTIVGNKLKIDRNNKAGFRAWFHAQASAWSPNGAGTIQIKIDCSGYYHSDCKDVNDDGLDGLDLIPAVQACGSNADCRATSATGFGESWAKCGGATPGFCDNAYVDKGGLGTPSPEGTTFCDPDPPNNGPCSQGDAAVSTCNYLWFVISDLSGVGHTDRGGLYYIGTLVLDLPAEAKGTYKVNLNPDETFMATADVSPVDIPTLEENGFEVEYVTGSCCHNLGGPLAGCYDSGARVCVTGLTIGAPCLSDADCGDTQNPGRCGTEQNCLNRSDCETAANAPFVFTPDGQCDQKGTPAGCSECTGNVEGVDLTCNDNDACTTETCTLVGNPPIGVCTRGNVSGYVAGTCCDPTNGSIVPTADTNACTDDKCSLDPQTGTPRHGNGVPVHTGSSATTSCNDLNPCTYGDHCAGAPSTSCTGTLVTGEPCANPPFSDCTRGGATPPGICGPDGNCTCSPKPKVTYDLKELFPGKICIGGDDPGAPCAKDTDCAGGGVCDLFPANCYDPGEKVAGVVHIGAAGSPINGGQFLLKYDPSCVSYNGVECLPPYTTTVFGPIVNKAAGTIFIACGVDPFLGVDGPLGNTDMLAVSYTMIGQCNNCFLGFGADDSNTHTGVNPLNTYLVDNTGQKVGIEPQSKEISEFGDLVLTVPPSVDVNSDCDMPAKVVTWAAPTATFSCGEASLVCRGAHESGLALSPDVIMHGGLLPQGANSFCCFAQALDKCDQTAGCQGDTNNCSGSPKPDGCWTVNVSDQTSMDIHIQLEPPIADKPNGVERCIEFCLYGNCLEPPYCFQDFVLFDGLYNYVGKADGKIKVPKGKYGCITAQDQLHTLRSCDSPDCIDGQLVARFKGDPIYGGNWLIGGNLDGWKKLDPTADPSLDVIDILDFGTFVSQFGVCYTNPSPGCHDGPNADINGDGCVTMADYSFVIRNFMVSAKDCCCGPQAADLPPALTEVTIDELRQMGHGDLAVADLNGDGVVNAADMDAFTQGVRPAKANDRKGGKGLRSGR